MKFPQYYVPPKGVRHLIQVLAPELDTLRAYRDQVLSRSPLGRRLTEFYYRTSPPVARFIADKPLLRALVRQALRPVISWARRQLAQ